MLIGTAVEQGALLEHDVDFVTVGRGPTVECDHGALPAKPGRGLATTSDGHLRIAPIAAVFTQLPFGKSRCGVLHRGRRQAQVRAPAQA